MKVQRIKLAKIDTNAGTQIRARLDEDTVEQYSEAMRDATVKFPPVIVFRFGGEFILADGFHRVMAATHNGFLDIDAEVHEGGKPEALKYALGANAAHGLKRTNADKRRSVELALAEWPKLSDRELARICAVNKDLPAAVRAEQVADSATCDDGVRVGGDGKTYNKPKRKEASETAAGEDRAMTAKDIREAAEDEPARVRTADEEMLRSLGEVPEESELTPLQRFSADLPKFVRLYLKDLSEAPHYALTLEVEAKRLRREWNEVRANV